MASQTWIQAVACTMLLAKIAVGACPDGYEQNFKVKDGIFWSECIINSTEPLIPTSEQNLTSKEFMCHPAAGNLQCCLAAFLPDSLEINQSVYFSSYIQCKQMAAGTYVPGDGGYVDTIYCNQTDPLILEDNQFPEAKLSNVFCGDNLNIIRPTPLNESNTCPPNFVLSNFDTGQNLNGSICAPSSGTGISPALDPSVNPSKEMLCAQASTEHTCCFTSSSIFPVIQNGTSLHRFYCVTKNLLDAAFTDNPYCNSREPVLHTDNSPDVSWMVDCSLEAPDAADDSGLSTGAIAGISVGAVAGVALIGTAAYFALKENAKKTLSL